jgi:RNA polymerase sigma-70 factor (ECF subfamily)
VSDEELASAFAGHRPYLHAIAYRMLGSHADADDAVQEAWVRLARAGGDGIAELRGWLTTVTARLSLDMLRSRGVRGEQPLEVSLSLPRNGRGDDAAAGPEAEALLADSVSLALYVVMDALTPAERVAFVLHDVFDVPFGLVADVLGRSADATKMLASRARGKVRLSEPGVTGTPGDAGGQASRDVIDAFFAAARAGDIDALVGVLAPDVVLRAAGPGGSRTARGAATVAARAAMFARTDAVLHPVTAGGLPGVLVMVNGRPVTLFAFLVQDGKVSAVSAVNDPERLARVIPPLAG